MSPLSLEKNLRTCKVNTGWANRNQSDRFQDPSLMVCPTWHHMDMTGRVVCADSFYTKRAGCNSPLDRVMVENTVSRPQYATYVNLNVAAIVQDGMNGVTGAAGNGSNNAAAVNSQLHTNHMAEGYNHHGSWGQQNSANVLGNCPNRAYQQGMQQMARQQNQVA